MLLESVRLYLYELDSFPRNCIQIQLITNALWMNYVSSAHGEKESSRDSLRTLCFFFFFFLTAEFESSLGQNLKGRERSSATQCYLCSLLRAGVYGVSCWEAQDSRLCGLHVFLSQVPSIFSSLLEVILV